MFVCLFLFIVVCFEWLMFDWLFWCLGCDWFVWFKVAELLFDSVYNWIWFGFAISGFCVWMLLCWFAVRFVCCSLDVLIEWCYLVVVKLIVLCYSALYWCRYIILIWLNDFVGLTFAVCLLTCAVGLLWMCKIWLFGLVWFICY